MVTTSVTLGVLLATCRHSYDIYHKFGFFLLIFFLEIKRTKFFFQLVLILYGFLSVTVS